MGVLNPISLGEDTVVGEVVHSIPVTRRAGAEVTASLGLPEPGVGHAPYHMQLSLVERGPA